MHEQDLPPPRQGALADAAAVVSRTLAIVAASGERARRSRENYARALANLAADAERLERSRELLRGVSARRWSPGDDGGGLAASTVLG